MAAYYAGPRTMAELLLCDLCGHDPNARNKDGCTPDDYFSRFLHLGSPHVWPRVPSPRLVKDRQQAWVKLMAKARQDNSLIRIEELESDDEKLNHDSEDVFFDVEEA